MSGLPRTPIEVLRKAIAGTLQDVHVALPGQVVAFSAVTGLADVQVLVEHSVWDDDNGRSYEDIGVLPGVPVVQPRGGGFIVSLPIAVGDTGLLVFNSTAIGEWRESNQKSQPVDSDRHSIGWPVFFPGLFADTSPMAAGDATARAGSLVIGKDGGSTQIRITATEIDLGVNATDFVALASLVDARLSAIQSKFDAHTHTVSVPALGLAAPAGGGPVTGSASATSAAPASPVGALASVAATLAKAL